MIKISSSLIPSPKRPNHEDAGLSRRTAFRWTGLSDPSASEGELCRSFRRMAVLRQAILLSQPEQVLYHRLVKALPEHMVLAQVQVSRVLGVKKGFNFLAWNNRINRLSYDFVLCGKDASVLAVIELDDQSHDNPDRADTDQKKDRATAAAGLRLLRWHVKSLPDESAIQAAFVPPILITVD
ncbi:DUF2726 domain-containing protein [Piscinibacter sp. HJYY11]|uniref:DUF2726 domain-containing protein n=1 Tax=Piscinibacter sp. HJYY11 TaxID=2801333 RepID=UPI00191D52C0|nr:DUF2726 domain-containing protein [Piscinibacter sp. HJYY11]MBL0726589.1 DUF2726 domain-containing protein [Piscinibacter sp. HJYY11]